MYVSMHIFHILHIYIYTIIYNIYMMLTDRHIPQLRDHMSLGGRIYLFL